MPEDDVGLALHESVRPPMANGEVIFEEPWQGRTFAMAVSLHEAGVFEWAEFQQTLIDVIGEWELGASGSEPYRYYEHFQAALQRLLLAKDVLSGGALKQLAGRLADRPHGHDH